MTNEELEEFVDKYISLRLKLGKTQYADKAVRQAMVDTAFYISALQQERDISKSLEYWHKILDSQGINPVVFVDYVEYFNKD